MSIELDLADIQGGILTAYGRMGFPKGRFILFHFDNPEGGRRFVSWLLPWVTTALRWPSERKAIPQGQLKVLRPQVALNIAFTFSGLYALQVPTRTLRGLPDEFIDGMIKRAPMLGDDAAGPGWAAAWDPIWTAGQHDGAKAVQMLVTLNAQMNPDGTPVAELANVTKQIADYCGRPDSGVRLLAGHRGTEEPFQNLSAVLATLPNGNRMPVAKEHFGFTDAIGDPVFEGQLPGRAECDRVIGNGKLDGKGKWSPLATGEFLLGYPDEAQEIPGAAMPLAFSRNGTFMSYRKLHENVFAFRSFIQKTAVAFGCTFGINDPQQAEDTLMAKISGRWPDGVPVSRAPDIAAWHKFNQDFPEPVSLDDKDARKKRDQALADFTYGEDKTGSKCPVTAHMRRVNTRDMLAPAPGAGSVLNNRRRILRRGLPYGDAPAGLTDDHGEHGIIMLSMCSSLFRQFEFVQQQWINYGLDFNAGNDTCPLTGNRPQGDGANAKFVIPADPMDGHPPFIVDGLPQFVETRGGDYFFVPSMTALRMIGLGVVDPT
jgi:deferrochelatase/peroxidase EfeB